MGGKSRGWQICMMHPEVDREKLREKTGKAMPVAYTHLLQTSAVPLWATHFHFLRTFSCYILQGQSILRLLFLFPSCPLSTKKKQWPWHFAMAPQRTRPVYMKRCISVVLPQKIEWYSGRDDAVALLFPSSVFFNAHFYPLELLGLVFIALIFCSMEECLIRMYHETEQSSKKQIIKGLFAIFCHQNFT